MAVTEFDQLLERDAELDFVDELIGEAVRGAGRVAAVEGSAGMGKTTLLAAIGARTARAGARLLSACGADLERDLAFGVVRQLFEPVLSEATEDERAELLAGAARLASPALLLDDAVAADPSAALHGLYWLCANLTERGPVALVVDDAHWADTDSLRWLAYLARRIDSLPLLLVLAVRREESDEDGSLAAITTGRRVGRVALSPLSESAAARVIRRSLGEEADAVFCRACHQATGGNPFYLGELLAAIREEGFEPNAHNSIRVSKLAPASVARSILLRLGRLGKNAVALAHALAVLGPDASLRRAAVLADLDPETAQLKADRLIGAELLRPIEPVAFVHPIVTASVYEEIEPGARSIAHKSAARMMDTEEASPDRVAVHLIATAPVGDEWVVERLFAAADWAVARAAPEAAASFLRRALAEPPAGQRRVDALFELGRVERLVDTGAALADLAEAVQSTSDLRRRAERTLELTSALLNAGRTLEAVEACDRALATLAPGDRELALLLEAARCRPAREDPATAGSAEDFGKRFRGRLNGSTPAEREVLVELALDAFAHGGTVAELVGTLAPVLADGRFATEQPGDAIVVGVATSALTWADRLDEADELIARALADVRARGSLTGFARVSSLQALTCVRRGLLAEAEANARGVLEASALDPTDYNFSGARALLIDVLLERDELTEADAQLAHAALPDELPRLFPYTVLLHSRARLRLSQGRTREALADAMLCGERQEAQLIRNPSLIPWRSTAALAHAALGETDAARRLAADELETARVVGAPRAAGIALRVAGVIEPAGRGIPHLEEAVAVLSESAAQLEHARALVDLGRTLRQTGDRARARERLREGLDIAHRCGASALASNAREELTIAGARPRRAELRGREALTASELRVARMAADRMTNREIAQALFVTSKTVETHLRHVFQKLGVSARTELGQHLD